MKKVISDDALIEFLINFLYNLNQWVWGFVLKLAEKEFGSEGKKYIESLSEKERSRNVT